MAIGKEIKRLREGAGVSAENLAKWLGVNVDKLRKWELRDTNPKPADRVAIEKYFDCPTVELDKLDKFEFYDPVKLDETHELHEPMAPYTKDYQAKYYKMLEDDNKTLRELVVTLRSLVQKVEGNLDVLLENQLTTTAMTVAFQEVALEKISGSKEEYNHLRQTAHSRGAARLKVSLRRGNRVEMDSVDNNSGA